MLSLKFMTKGISRVSNLINYNINIFMSKKLIRQYTQNLRTTRDSKIGKVPPDIQAKINKIVDLYEDRKISQYQTANKLINDISINDTKKRKTGLKRYDKAVAKYEEAEPITERMAKTAKKARTGKEVKAVIKTRQATHL